MGVVYTMRGGDNKGCIGRNTCATRSAHRRWRRRRPAARAPAFRGSRGALVAERAVTAPLQAGVLSRRPRLSAPLLLSSPD